MPLNSRLISLLLLLAAALLPAAGRTCYPDTVGQRAKYELTIDMPKAHIGGILIMARTAPEQIDASLINEFGISLLDFTYNEKKDKIKLHNVIKVIDRWYIKRVLKSDLKDVMHMMRDGENAYYDRRHDIRYTFDMIEDNMPEEKECGCMPITTQTQQ